MTEERLNINVENEFATAILAIGGVRVTNLLGHAPSHDNADYFFKEHAVIAELKCLEEDKIADDRIIEKASQLYLEELQSGRAPLVAFGTVQLTTEGFSEEYKQKIGNLYRVPIERQVRKADRQIQETAKAMKVERPIGLLLLANNNHSALDPQHLWHIAKQILATGAYPAIDAAIVFSGNLGSAMPNSSDRIDYWIELPRADKQLVPDPFFTMLRQAWFARLAHIFGRDNAPTAVLADMSTLYRLESR